MQTFTCSPNSFIAALGSNIQSKMHYFSKNGESSHVLGLKQAAQGPGATIYALKIDENCSKDICLPMLISVHGIGAV